MMGLDARKPVFSGLRITQAQTSLRICADRSAPLLFAFLESIISKHTGRVAQSVTCLATDASLTADPGVVSSIPARSHTFVEIDHEIISTVILLPSAESFKKSC